jgi:O-antigen/teichoic acid export membrane protein
MSDRDPAPASGPAPQAEATAVAVGLSVAELQSRAIRGSIWTALHTLISVPVAFVANAVVAQVLGPASYGELAFFTLSLSVLVLVSNAGFSDGVIQWGAAAEASGRRADADRLLRKSLGFHVLIQFPLLVLAVLLLAHDEPGWVVVALLVSVAIPAFAGSSSLALTIENRTAAAARLVMVTNLALQASLVVAALVAKTAAGVWATRSVVAGALVPFNFLLLDKSRRRTARQLELPRQMPEGFWRYALGACGAAVIGTLVFSRSEIFILQAFPDPVALGLFALAFGISVQVTAPVDALLGPLIPATAGLMSSAGNTAARAVRRALRFSALAAGFILACVVPPLYCLLATIYGEEYADAAALFAVLAAVSCLRSCFNPLVAFAHARRESGALMRIYGLSLALDIAVAVPTIALFGVWGAVAGNAASQLLSFAILVRREAARHQQAIAWVLSPLRGWLAAVGALVISIILGELAPSPLLAALVAGVAGIAVYVLLLRALRFALDGDDWRALAGVLPPRASERLALILRRLGLLDEALPENS